MTEQDGMTEEDGRNRRRFFRLQLPNGEELTAWIQGVKHLVTEVSEKSLRFLDSHVPNQDGVCHGVLVWHDKRLTEFVGVLGPIRYSQRVIINVRGVSLADVVKEQRRLLAKYPVLKTEWPTA